MEKIHTKDSTIYEVMEAGGGLAEATMERACTIVHGLAASAQTRSA